MKYLKEIRQCPNGWDNCSECANERMCEAGLYRPEATTDLEVVIKAAEICERVVQADAVEAAEKCRSTWAEEFGKMSYNDRMSEFYRYHPPSLIDKIPIPLDGPSAPGGGSKAKMKKSRTGNKVFTDVWEGI